MERIEGHGLSTPATRAGDWIFVPGQKSLNKDCSALGRPNFEAQAETALDTLSRVLKQARASLSAIVKLTAYLVDPRDIESFHAICARTFPTHPPTGVTVTVSSLQDPDALIEIEAIAYLNPEGKKPINWSNSRTGPFSDTIKCGHTILISSLTAENSGPDFNDQLFGVYDNTNAALAKLGAGQKDLVKINYYIANPLYYRRLYRIREKVFEVDWPGDSVVSVRALGRPGALVQCDAVALAPTAKAEFVNSPNLPPPFNFSSVVVADGLAYVSGQVARDKNKRLILPGDFNAQFRQGLRNVEIALDSVGCTFEQAVKLSCFLSHPGYFEEALAIRQEIFGNAGPAITCVAVDSMGGFPEALCEIDAIAAVS